MVALYILPIIGAQVLILSNRIMAKFGSFQIGRKPAILQKFVLVTKFQACPAAILQLLDQF